MSQLFQVPWKVLLGQWARFSGSRLRTIQVAVRRILSIMPAMSLR